MSHYGDTTRCDFCGKSREVVEHLVNGAGVDICDECVAEAAHLIAERRMIEDWQAWKAEVPQVILSMGGTP